MRRYRYHYYNIEIPPDCSSDPEERFNLAILQAKEQAKLFIVPCDWTKVRDDGNIVRVCRKSRKMIAPEPGSPTPPGLSHAIKESMRVLKEKPNASQSCEHCSERGSHHCPCPYKA